MSQNKDLIGGLLRAAADVKNPLVLGELGILAASLALAGLGAYLLRPRIQAAAGGWALGRGGLNRVSFPLLGLLFLSIGKAIFFKHTATPLFDVAVPLLVSLAIIRLTIYLMRHVFPPNPLLKASERLIAYVVWIGVALHITGALPYVSESLDSLSFTAGKQKISLLLVVQAFVTIVVTVLVALWLARLAEDRLMRAQHLDSSLRVMLGKVVRAALLVAAILVALPAVGIDMTVLSVFGGALGVGIGFGLQKIASNYVSGFIILSDRSIRLGDLVTVDNRHGIVSQLNTRYTVIKSLDGTEAIIPNETLITNTVVNHSYTDRRVTLKLPVQISYKSSLERALEILAAAPRGLPRILSDPGPGAFIKGFGESGIDLELVAWISDPEQGQGPLRSALYFRIWREFQANGIEIPYPQREIRLLEGEPEAKPAPR